MSRSLYLIDGHAQIFRAYYAIRGGMRSPVTGEPTHAVFGFAGMLFKLLGELRPDFVAVAMDVAGPTFRDEMFGEYKATRNATPEDLTAQEPRIVELIRAFGLPVLTQTGFEADDVIATVVQRILDDPDSADIQIRIASKDKDLEQLLGPRVALCDIQNDTVLDVEGLKLSKGIAPQHVVDVLALSGDTADNVPGVPGIGTKTAAQLVAEFGSIEGIFQNIDLIKGKRRENLEACRETIPLSRRLVTLVRDAPVDFSLEAARVRPLPTGPLLALFEQLGFNRYRDEAHKLAGSQVAVVVLAEEVVPVVEAGASSAPELPPFSGDYKAITTLAEIDELAATLAAQSIISVDTETTGLGRDARLCGLSFAWREGQGVYVPVLSPEPSQHLDTTTVLASLRPLLEDPNLPKCGHNLKFDAGVLLRYGVHLQGVVFDSMLASAVSDAHQAAHKLDEVAARLLGGRMIPLSPLLKSEEGERTVEQVPLEQIVPYAAEDADVALRLYHTMSPRLKEMNLDALVRDVEAPLAVVLAEMESNGILCDPAELVRQGVVLGERVAAVRAEIYAAAGCEFDLNSTRQIAEVLFDRLGLAVGKKTKTGRSTDVEVLEKLAATEDAVHPPSTVPRLLLEYRQLSKLISTYLGNLRSSIDPASGRIHSTFHQLVTATGRLASHNPNLQNIPVRSENGRQIRKAFHAAPGHRLICADYSQIELRVLAHLSEDEALLEAFRADLDIHAAVAAQVFNVPLEEVTREQRTRAKTVNFGIIYGVTPYGLARRIRDLDTAAAKVLIDDYKRRFPGLDRFLQSCIAHALDHGFVCTILGRRRAIPEISSSNAHTRALGERLAINSVVQGSAADLIKIAMVNVSRRIAREKRPLRLLLQIHDELVLEAPEEEAVSYAALVREEMENALTLRVPLRAEAGIGANWLEAK